MILELSAVAALVTKCAPGVAPETLIPILKTESGFNSLAIGVNGGPPLVSKPRTRREAAAAAGAAMTVARSVDLGLAQINSRNLKRLELSLEDAFEPCSNIAAAGRLLAMDYRLTRRRSASDQAALIATLSRYNTGHDRHGVTNGYVAKVQAAARYVVPALYSDPEPAWAEVPETVAPTDVFARGARSGALVFKAAAGAAP